MEGNSKWDLKQVGSGAGFSAMLLFLMQSQGVTLINDKQSAQSQVIIEKTIANTQRIERNEEALKDINEKIEEGFKGLREQIAQKRDFISQLVEIKTKDRWSRDEHKIFADDITEKLKELNSRIRKIEEDYFQIKYKSGEK